VERALHLDIKHLANPRHAPYLEASFNEVLRLHNTAAAVRVARERTVLGAGTTVVPAGALLVLPFRPLHTDAGVWGADARLFAPERFLQEKGEKEGWPGEGEKRPQVNNMSRSPSFRPFGGGATYCPGRTLARHEVFGFVAILLHRFDVRLAGGKQQAFPRLNSVAPSFGLNGPMKGEDVIVEVMARPY
jgi:cholesterol 7alpha-monooxygenase